MTDMWRSLAAEWPTNNRPVWQWHEGWNRDPQFVEHPDNVESTPIERAGWWWCYATVPTPPDLHASTIEDAGSGGAR